MRLNWRSMMQAWHVIQLQTEGLEFSPLTYHHGPHTGIPPPQMLSWDIWTGAKVLAFRVLFNLSSLSGQGGEADFLPLQFEYPHSTVHKSSQRLATGPVLFLGSTPECNGRQGIHIPATHPASLFFPIIFVPVALMCVFSDHLSGLAA